MTTWGSSAGAWGRVDRQRRIRWRRLRPGLGAACAVVVVAAAACADDAPAASSAAEAEGDGILSTVEVTPGPTSTLSAVVEAETTEEAAVSVTLDGAEGATDPPETESGTSHEVPVVGMRAETTYTLTVTAEGADGAEGSASVDWTTGSLPEGLPEVQIDTADGDEMAEGVTLFNAMTWGTDGEAQESGSPGGSEESGGPGGSEGAEQSGGEGEQRNNGYLVAVDGEGEVVWYYETGPSLTEVSQTAEGTLLVLVNDTTIREIDLLGNTVSEFASRVAVDLGSDVAGQQLTTDDSEPMDIDSSHHEIFELDNGNLVTLSTEVIELTQAEAEVLCPDAPEADIVSDIVVELSPEGEVVQEWPLTEAYDPRQRPGVEMCVDQPVIAPPSWFYPQAEGTRDWTHANAAVVDEENNQLLVSVRHLDAVVALRYQEDAEGPAGELLWELGPDGTLEMTGEGEWPYHQHAPELGDDGSILLYDNGNHRPGTSPDGEGSEAPYSRAVLYEVDEEAGTVTQTWEHRDEDSEEGTPVYAEFLSDADRLDNGNVLVTHGGEKEADDTRYARVLEVVPGDEPDGSDDQTVFDMTVGGGEEGWTVYRADRLASLYGTGEPAG